MQKERSNRVNIESVINLAAEMGSHDPVRVAWGAIKAIGFGADERETILLIRKHQPGLFR